MAELAAGPLAATWRTKASNVPQPRRLPYTINFLAKPKCASPRGHNFALVSHDGRARRAEKPCGDRRTISLFLSGSRRKFDVGLQCACPGFAGANPDNVLQVGNENLPVADLTCLCRLGDGI